MLQQRIRQLLFTALFCCGFAIPASSHAFSVESKVSGQVSATADFRPGVADKPAILLLHGFLQTRDFAIIKSLMDELSSAGYSVLAPNLSLGISYRKSSLSCEALHLHDMEGDIREIQHWMEWLRARGYKKLVGIGHSFGATQLVAWRTRYHQRDFDLIGISLVSSASFVPSSGHRPIYSGKSQPDLVRFPLSFCETYTAPAEKYLSYHKWDNRKLLDTLKSSKSQTDIILGSHDKYLPRDWKESLIKSGARVHLINGANHFMEGTQEFDMLDATLNILRR